MKGDGYEARPPGEKGLITAGSVLDLAFPR